MPQPSTLRVLDGSVAVRTAGSGPPIVLVHGTSCSSRTFARQLEGRLAQRHRLLAIDLPGHGESARVPETYSPRGYADVLVRALAELDAEDAVLVGWSLGLHIVLEAAPRLPRAAGYLVYGGAPAASMADLVTAYHDDPAIGLAFRAELTDEEVAAVVALFVRRGTPVPAFFAEDFRGADPLSRTAVGEAAARGEMSDKRALLRELAVPVAILHGAHDAIVRRAFFDTLEAPTLWRGAVQDVAGAGHALHWEVPEAFDELLGAFAHDCRRAR